MILPGKRFGSLIRSGGAMKLGILGLVTVLCTAACATAGVTSREAVSKIETGMTRAEVINLLGEPGKRSFMGNREVLQYCQTGFGADSYTAVWLRNGVVTGLSQDDMRLGVEFSCAEQYPRIDWGHVHLSGVNWGGQAVYRLRPRAM